MISQHYYVCGLEKRSKYENYTIAKSPDLKDEYIKEYFEPLCKYIINSYMNYIYEDKEFADKGFVLNLIPTGELVISQISYKQIGEEKFCLFIHSYILSGIEKQRFVKMPEKIFGINNFGTLDIDSIDRNLPTLAAIPYEESNVYFKNRDSLLGVLGINREDFVNLVQAVITAVDLDNRVWVRLSETDKEREGAIKAFLYHIHKEVPWIIGEKIGVNTRGKWRMTFPNVHLTFLSYDEIVPEEIKENDYVFDFKNRTFYNIENIVEIPRYFKNKEKFSKNRNLWEKYNLYVSEIYRVGSRLDGGNINLYEYMAILFGVYMSKIENQIYIICDSDRNGLIKELVRCMTLPLKPEVLKELDILMRYLLENLKTSLRNGSMFSYEEVDALIEYERLHINRKEIEGIQNEILFHDIIVRAASLGDLEYIRHIMLTIKNDFLLYKYIFNILYEKDSLREDIIYTYFERKVSVAKNLEDIMRQIRDAEKICIVEDEFYISLIIRKVREFLEEADDLYYLFDVITRECSDKDKSIYNKLLIFAEGYFIQKIDIQQLDDEDKICKLNFVNKYDGELYDTIIHYQNLRRDLRQMSPQCIIVNKTVQEQIKIVYRKGLNQDRFYMIIYAFLIPSKNIEEGLSWELDLKSALGYMYDINEKLAVEFIIWSKGHKLYINAETFNGDVIQFFKNRIDSFRDVNMKTVKKYLYSNYKTKQLFISLNSSLMKNKVSLKRIYGVITTVENKIKNKK